MPGCGSSAAPTWQDEALTVDGYKVYASPWQPEFCRWAFNLPRGPRLAAVWRRIPEDTDILVTHTPPAHILDGEGTGCSSMPVRGASHQAQACPLNRGAAPCALQAVDRERLILPTPRGTAVDRLSSTWSADESTKSSDGGATSRASTAPAVALMGVDRDDWTNVFRFLRFVSGQIGILP